MALLSAPGAPLATTRMGSPSPRSAKIKSVNGIRVRAASGGGCCGGSESGSSSSGGSCSSHRLTMPELDYDPAGAKASKSGLENVGKEFEALVAHQTLLELEKDYETTQMRGTISKEEVQEAMNIVPVGKTASEHGNSCVDIDELLSDAADCNFVFQQGEEEIVLV